MTGGPLFWSTVSFGRCLRHRNYRDDFAAFSFGSERNLSIDKREQRVVLTHSDIIAGVPGRAALTGDDVAGHDGLAAECLQAKAAARGVAAVT
jgi:hypothetical protein